MNIFTFFVFLSFSIQTWATQVICQAHVKDVKVKISWESENIVVQVESPMGYLQLPLIEGPVRAGNLDWNQYQVQQLEPLSSQFEVQFAKKQCKWTVNPNKKDTKLECQGPSLKAPKELLFTSLTLTRLTESTLNNEYFTRRFRMTVVRNGQWGADTFFVTIPVAESGCQDYE